ncbi:barstar family protein [Lentzea sp. BCCO 10_0061]|uniref:Barstar family protein n=1 Tax=Lentzea sokolovensis TaxID=3095429 RepID=A0ABU4URJ1_9PSEU|nr:barstar family protein [Lentzea sp. BCCO 10_0061]MDX8142044.1 barstar family protein [Lentzea sp. BCCO 10_0061]
MAPFDPRAFFNEGRDFQLLGEHGYQVTRIDASTWSGLEDLHRDVAAALDFPDHYGRNFNALNDCLRDVVHQHHGWTPGTTGLARGLDHAGPHREVLPRGLPLRPPSPVPGPEQRPERPVRARRGDDAALERRRVAPLRPLIRSER